MQASDEFGKCGCCETGDSSMIVTTEDPRSLKLKNTTEKECSTSKSSMGISNALSESVASYPRVNNGSSNVSLKTITPHPIITAQILSSDMISCQKGCCGSHSLESIRTQPVFMKPASKTRAPCCGGESRSSIGEDNCSYAARHSTSPVYGSCCARASADSVTNKHVRHTNPVPIPPKTPFTSNCCGDLNSSCQTDQRKNVGPKPHRRNELLPEGYRKQDQIDIERAVHEIDHVLVRVQGMDCSGCETKLYRSLATLPELSNINTSLLLAQAEFDLLSSSTINVGNILSIMERMTGFTCSKIPQSGAELEFIVEGDPKQFLEKLPEGVKEVAILGKHTIRVFYQPRIIGARKLIGDPFFRRSQITPPSSPPLIAAGKAHLRYMFYMTLLSAVLTIPVLVLAWGHLRERPVLYGAISLALATIVQVVIAGPFYSKTLKALMFSRMIDMDLLVVLSSSAAYIYSIVAYAYIAVGKPLATGQFFETSTLLITLIMVGRTVSAIARQKAVESITIESLQTPTALLLDQKKQEVEEIDARLLQYRDIFQVLPDTSVVTDGVVLSGESEVDESMVTGEATLVHKGPGSTVLAGSVNNSGSLVVRVRRLPHENTLKTISAMVDEAKSSKPQIQEVADRVASYFVPTILALTLVVFVAWFAIGKLDRHQSSAISAVNAMTYGISVLIVSCPCAIGLAVPMVVMIAGGVAAKHGLIFKTAETIDIARGISHVVFDKTGTLTQGKLYVVADEYLNTPRESVDSLILGLTANSKHPVSVALAAHLSAQDVQPSVLENIVSVAGKGMEAISNGSIIRAGNPYWLEVDDHPCVRRILLMGVTLFCVTRDDVLVAVYGFQDLLRPDAAETVAELKKRHIKISLISGDNKAAVESIGIALGISIDNIRFRCSPEEKQTYIRTLLDKPALPIEQRIQKNTILFIGDGTNDAPSLAQASIGLHMSDGGTDVAKSAADAVLMRPSLKGILTLIDLSKAFHRRVVFNFAWSFVYNLCAILLAAGVFGKARIPPQYAGLGEVISVVPVVCVAVGLRWWRG